MKVRSAPPVGDDAALLVRSLIEQGPPPVTSGMSSTVNPSTDSLPRGRATRPDPSDVVVRRNDAVLFLSAPEVEQTKGRTLRASTVPTGTSSCLDR